MTYIKVLYIYLNKTLLYCDKGRITVLRFCEKASLLLCPSLMTFTYQIVPCPRSFGFRCKGQWHFNFTITRPEMQLLLRITDWGDVHSMLFSIYSTFYLSLNKAVCKGTVMCSNVKSKQSINIHWVYKNTIRKWLPWRLFLSNYYLFLQVLSIKTLFVAGST